ncbi:RtcB family protein [Sphingobacterium suaedae]|uniref:3'-phosphate/5'-hydroxy nucleic acid ligase n=1 Tax=Sphingobacterium suaedae TaxID=1686402 RepID=A0ABW5KB07_9SPHI
MGGKLAGKELIKLGFSKSNTVNIVLGQIHRYYKREKKDHILSGAKKVLLEPSNYRSGHIWGEVAERLAMPVASGAFSVIPQSMTAPKYLVEGKDNTLSLNCTSLEDGSLLSHNSCKNTKTKSDLKKVITRHDIKLIGHAVDEALMAYKDIKKVSSLPHELVIPLGTFTPKIVRMDK